MAARQNSKTDSLIERLKSLGVNITTGDSHSFKYSQKYQISNVVDGEFHATKSGETFIVTQDFNEKYLHGQGAILPAPPFNTIAAWAKESKFSDLPIEAYAFLDTETSGLSGGTGTYAFMVGVARFVNETPKGKKKKFSLKQFFMQDPSEEPALLESLSEFLSPCQALVTFNGKAFDVPLLSTRYSLHGAPNPMRGMAHLDLLPLARRIWRDRLPSRELKYLEENILHAPRSQEEVPGYEIPYLYFDYLRSGDARPLKGVFYHNAMDVVTMAALLTHMTQLLDDPFGDLNQYKLDVIAVARMYEDLGRWDTAARLFEKGLERDESSQDGEPVPEMDFWLAIRRLSRLQKRRGDMETALVLWEKAAARGYIYAHVELAKYYEHAQRDYEAALVWTEKATLLMTNSDIPEYEYNFWKGELLHREERLKKKQVSQKNKDL